MKKIIGSLVLFLIFFLQNSYADNVSLPYISSSFYASAGITNLTRGDTLEVSNWSNNFTFFRAPDNGNNIGLDFLLGYQKILNNFVLGINGAYRYFPGPLSKSVKLNAINAPRVSTTSNFGLEFRPGFLINPQVSVYGILGLEKAYYKVRYLLNQTHTTFSGWQYGPGFGLGCDIALTMQFLLQLNYLYIHYQNLNFSDHAARTNVVLDPKMNIFTLAISYQFGFLG